MITITHYDFCNVQFVSYFLEGVEKLAAEYGIRFRVSRQVPQELKEIEDEMWNAWLWHLGSRSEYGVFRYEDEDGEDFLFCVDGTDRNGDITTGGLDPVVLAKCKYYFKVNYNEEALLNNPQFAPYAEKVRPFPHIFPIAVPKPWLYLPDVVGIAGRRWPTGASKARMKMVLNTTKLDTFRELREYEKDLDVYFLAFLYPTSWNPVYEQINLRRLAIVEGLNQLDNRNILAGFGYYSYKTADFGDHVDEKYHSRFKPYELKRFPREEHLHNMARSRVGIYVQGVDRCTAFKFGEIMALAKPIVGERLFNNNEQMYSYPRFDEQFAYDDPHKLVARVEYLLQNPELMQELHETNANTFDTMLTPEPVVRDMLDQLAA